MMIGIMIGLCKDVIFASFVEFTTVQKEYRWSSTSVCNVLVL